MQQSVRAMSKAVLVAGLTLSGCSSFDTRSTTPTAATSPKPIRFKSTAVVSGALPARYTCDGMNISPPMEWGSVPSSTKELALLLVGFIPGSTPNSYNLSIEWAVAGLSSKLHHLGPGQLPSGAYLGGTSSGKTRYSVCPDKGTSRQYEFVLYAIPAAVKIPRGFVGMQILSRLGSPTAPTPASASGNFEVRYRRH